MAGGGEDAHRRSRLLGHPAAPRRIFRRFAFGRQRSPKHPPMDGGEAYSAGRARGQATPCAAAGLRALTFPRRPFPSAEQWAKK
eukprot:CAMPEP_0170384994 /NCGR_PEP_ID=MMETSP0117_2-20130122/16286_1 /TAXON_ID=400756 /ORGANISM="Durinskia baltica, Strain CSIRO CS-38" /LENGTH=83 /DNA_ID=CAMNT_0010640763 /DNA_START=306 /DNA_END=554 /DNA_ORIENTATION=+